MLKKIVFIDRGSDNEGIWSLIKLNGFFFFVDCCHGDGIRYQLVALSPIDLNLTAFNSIRSLDIPFPVLFIQLIS